MEGIEAAAGIIAVLELTAKIATVCLRYSSAVKNARPDIQQLQSQVGSLQATLEGAQKLLNGPNGGRLETAQKLRDTLNVARSQLEEINKRLEEKLDGRRRTAAMRSFGLRALTWPFQRSEFDKIIASLDRYQNDIAGALNVDQTAEVFRLHQKIDLSYLPIAKGAAFDSQANEHDPRCHPDTRLALLAELYKWIEEPGSKRVFWLRGMAGTGKSTISRTIAFYLHDKQIPTASFFFKRGEGDRGHAGKFLTTIAFQLIRQMPCLGPHVCEAVNRDAAIFDKNKKEQFEKLIFEPLEKCKGSNGIPGIVQVVIDALDECDPEEDATAIVYLLAQAKKVTSTSLKFLVTSRPELPIRLGFRHLGDSYEDLALHEISQDEIAHDISTYFHFRLAEICKEFNMAVMPCSALSQDWPSPANLQCLVNMAVPLFIFASTCCRFIADRTCGDPDEQLVKILHYQSAEAVSQLHTTYLPVLNQLFLKQADKGWVERTKREKDNVLTWFRETIGAIVLLAEPLCLASLARLLQISQRQLDTRLAGLHSVLQIPVNPHVPIRLLHLSFRDFLVDQTNCEGNPFWVDRDPVCLPVLTESRRAIRDEDEVHRFLITHLLHWLEVLALLGRVSHSLSMISSLMSLMDMPHSIKLSAFLRDARRFILSSRTGVNAAPLQVYSSALLFAPERSEARNIFQDRIPPWISLIPRVDTVWKACLQIFECYMPQTLAFSSDGSTLACVSRNEIQLWDLMIGNCNRPFGVEENSPKITSVSLSPDSRQVAAGYEDGSCKLWEIAKGACVRELFGHKIPVRCVAFSPDGTWFASAADRAIKLWHSTSGDLIDTFESPGDTLDEIELSSDGKMLASIDGKNIWVWNIETRNVMTLNGGGAIAFSPDCKRLASSGQHIPRHGFRVDKDVKVWDIATGNCIKTIDYSYPLHKIIYLPGEIGLLSYNGINVKHWNMATGDSATLCDIPNEYGTACFSPDGSHLAISYFGGVKIYDTDFNSDNTSTHNNHGFITTVRVSPDTRWLASVSSGHLKIWNSSTGDCVTTLRACGFVSEIVFSSDSQWLAFASFPGTVQVANTRNWEYTTQFSRNTERIGAIAFSPDGRTLLTGSREGKIECWDVATRTSVLVVLEANHVFLSLIFSTDGSRVASVTEDNLIQIRDASTLKCIVHIPAKVERRSPHNWNLSFSPNGCTLASQQEFEVIQIWDAGNGSHIRDFQVGKSCRLIGFDETGARLHTDMGTLVLEGFTSITATEAMSQGAAVTPRWEGIRITEDRTWITWNSNKLLWLPPEYRPGCSAVWGMSLALGHKSDKIALMMFSELGLEKLFDTNTGVAHL